MGQIKDHTSAVKAVCRNLLASGGGSGCCTPRPLHALTWLTQVCAFSFLWSSFSASARDLPGALQQRWNHFMQPKNLILREATMESFSAFKTWPSWEQNASKENALPSYLNSLPS